MIEHSYSSFEEPGVGLVQRMVQLVKFIQEMKQETTLFYNYFSRYFFFFFFISFLLSKEIYSKIISLVINKMNNIEFIN